MKTVCILNPTAGRGKAEAKWQLCRKLLKERGLEVNTLVTSSRGDAAKLAEKAIAERIEIIIVAGGDGTINEVIGVAAETDVKLATVIILPIRPVSVLMLRWLKR